MNRVALGASIWLLVLVGMVGGCAVNPRHEAVDALLNQNMAQLSDGDLLRAYYELRRRALELGIDQAELTRMSNQYSTNSRIDQAFGARRSANNNLGGAIATAILAGMAQAQADAVVSKHLEARVELELRGWTPVLGFARRTPQRQQATQYIQRAPINEAVAPQSKQQTADSAATTQAIPSSQESESAQVIRYLSENAFSIKGDPVLFKRTGNINLYEVRATDGRASQVRCEGGNCRFRTNQE